jgi:TonB family protein
MRRLLIVWLVLSGYAGMATPSHGQDSPAPVTRKVVRKSAPVYPEMARRMNISGTVKVFAVVAPDGSVKAVQPVGGSPLLIQAAQEAISNWKFSPASAESRELIELHFNPN